MARVSRKQVSPSHVPELVDRIYRVGLYTRLSKEDSGYDSSDSIEMQQHLLEQYVKTQPDMKLFSVTMELPAQTLTARILNA